MSVILREVRDGVAVLTLHRPERRNAFTREMGRELGRLYRELDDDDAVRAIVLTGTPPAFCAGADFSGGDDTFGAPDPDDFTASPVQPAAFALRTPVIAAVNGHAMGIGMTIALQADIRIIATGARCAIPQVRLGVVPDGTSHWTLPRIAGMAVAADLLLTGRTFDGREAARLGLASRALPADEVLPAALAAAEDIARNVAPMSAALSKRLLWGAAARGDGPDAVAELETEAHLRLMGGPDATEGVRAKLDRRAPRWTARVSQEWKELQMHEDRDDVRDAARGSAAAPASVNPAGAPLGAGSTVDEVVAGADLHGRTAVVTGAGGGLGEQTARALASAGAAVVLAVRGPEAGAEAAGRIRAAVPGADIEVLALDLADLASVRRAAGALRETRPALDLLINNAGVMYPPLRRTADGFELQFGTNHLGHFLLTTALRPALEEAAQRSGRASRVVTVSSDAHRAYPVDLEDPDFRTRTYDKFAAYGRSKAANVLMTVEADGRWADRGVRAYAVHPGVCGTRLARHMHREDFAEMKRLTDERSPGLLDTVRPPEVGASTTVWAATTGGLEPHGGAYLADCALGAAEDHATDRETARALWAASEAWTAG